MNVLLQPVLSPGREFWHISAPHSSVLPQQATVSHPTYSGLSGLLSTVTKIFESIFFYILNKSVSSLCILDHDENPECGLEGMWAWALATHWPFLPLSAHHNSTGVSATPSSPVLKTWCLLSSLRNLFPCRLPSTGLFHL